MFFGVSTILTQRMEHFKSLNLSRQVVKSPKQTTGNNIFELDIDTPPVSLLESGISLVSGQTNELAAEPRQQRATPSRRSTIPASISEKQEMHEGGSHHGTSVRFFLFLLKQVLTLYLRMIRIIAFLSSSIIIPLLRIGKLIRTIAFYLRCPLALHSRM